MYLNLGKAADGTRILSEYGVREMCKPRQAYGAFGNYGYGVSMKQLDDLKVIEHGGALPGVSLPGLTKQKQQSSYCATLPMFR